jgi:hypothetical protein
MKRPIPGKQLGKSDVNLSDAQSIDVQYGLEPIIEPSSSADDGGAPGGVQFHLAQCPYCGEGFKTQPDTSFGSARHVEDCQICCQPIEFSLEVDHAGVLQALSVLRNVRAASANNCCICFRSGTLALGDSASLYARDD